MGAPRHLANFLGRSAVNWLFCQERDKLSHRVHLANIPALCRCNPPAFLVQSTQSKPFWLISQLHTPGGKRSRPYSVWFMLACNNQRKKCTLCSANRCGLRTMHAAHCWCAPPPHTHMARCEFGLSGCERALSRRVKHCVCKAAYVSQEGRSAGCVQSTSRHNVGLWLQITWPACMLLLPVCNQSMQA